MKITRPTSLLIPALASVALLSGACATEMDGEEIANAIELDDGGLDMSDELPLFGLDDEFTAAGELDVDIPIADELDTDPDVVAMMELPDAVVVRARILWGKMPADPDAETPRNWSGTLSVNRGALIVRSTIAFEGLDRLLPRENRRAVSFISRTLPHRDGLVLTIVDPTPESDEPLMLRYSTPAGDLYVTPVAALLDGPVSVAVDDDGNRVAGIALARPVDLCEHGFLGGKWHQVRPGFGRLIGRVVNADGDPIGHVRGIYGEKPDGERVFFGKYINRLGEFRGIFKGRYADGHFAGRWVTRAGERGVLGGEYREHAPGPRVGGHFLGRWAETTCGIDSE